ncbi:MAG: uroporphyrinogen decarboxylase [SAR324 cluster bacterium]|uniref:Uroporphyrinogen decarboxylase n=1 Tax=SAR324 cluster bacterium TaxID=2024889 RepID=A0A7X9FS84_9DELT|nr:uroporphyrinogen decarboxylase [SAR324 cluster bacterium]
MNPRFQNAINRIAQATPPIWCMRQAGRYHSHYQELRRRHSFIELCRTPELAAEVALGPIGDFDFDVAILFSDILFPLDALGMGLSFPENGGPRLSWYLNEDTILKLGDPNEVLEELLFQREAVSLTRASLASDKSLIGFVGGPFTLFAYAVEGTHKKGLARTIQLLNLYQAFEAKILPLLSENIKIQLEGGAELVMIFDTAAGGLSPSLFHKIVLPALRYLSESVGGRIGYYSKALKHEHLDCEDFRMLDMKGFGVDSSWDLKDAFKIRKQGFVQGNMNEVFLNEKPDIFQKELESFITSIRSLDVSERRGWVCSLGHGILPSAREENVRNFVREIRAAFS